jgi:DNA polymerase I-like protein with 3'-5' exonuclease and polymerase domains
MTLVSLDIETACNVTDCPGKGCAHALDEYRARITVVGVYYRGPSGPVGLVFRDLGELGRHLASLGDYRLVGHNLKFDLRHLAVAGLDLSAHWGEDTQLMAATLTEKVPEDWLAWYEAERKRQNEKLPRGYSHRQASQHSLKVLAPYFLNVPAFWEDPSNHDNDEYVLKDCRYTYELTGFLSDKLKAEGNYDFYRDKLLPWTKLLLKMEQRGIELDLSALEKADQEALAAAEVARAKLDTLWAEAHAAYFERQAKELRAEYGLKSLTAQAKAKDRAKCKIRYERLCEAAIAKLPRKINLDSPSQLAWLLKDHLGLEITNFHGDETTGKATLQKLAEGREDIKTFLEYRKQQKLASAFFPSYREMHYAAVLHCSFNPTGTRTGRLSSSNPNLQQVPGHLHKLFKARDGYRLATFDMSAIEPRLIAYFSHDLILFDLVNSGQDFHGYNAKVFFDLDCDVKEVKEAFPLERKMAKEVGLSLFYGAGTGRLKETSQKYGLHWNDGQCRRVLERFKEAYEGVYSFRDDILNPTLAFGHAVPNLFGRSFRIPDPTNVHMQGLNTLIQGSASDLVVNSATRIMTRFREAGIDGHVLLLVHDEIVTEVPAHREAEAVEIIKDAMTTYDLTTPLGPIKLEVEGKVAATWEK